MTITFNVLMREGRRWRTAFQMLSRADAKLHVGLLRSVGRAAKLRPRIAWRKGNR